MTAIVIVAWSTSSAPITEKTDTVDTHIAIKVFK